MTLARAAALALAAAPTAAFAAQGAAATSPIPRATDPAAPPGSSPTRTSLAQTSASHTPPSHTLAVRLDALRYDDGHAPSFEGALWLDPRERAALMPYAVVEGADEAALGLEAAPDWQVMRAAYAAAELAVAWRGAPPASVRGRVYLPDARGERLVAHPFTLDTSGVVPGASDAFERARHRHYVARHAAALPGAAWWRHRAEATRAAAMSAPSDGPEPAPTRPDFAPDRTFALLTGGRALSENLQLDEVLRAGAAAVPSIPIGELPGITVPEFDWAGYAQCADEGLDPLARYVPADHHAVFLPSFDALVRVVDELRAHGTPVLDLLEPRAEDARVQPRYEAQLALELDAAARMLGPRLVRSVAVTGGDPYLRTGSDLALAFDCADPAAFQAFALARIGARASEEGAAVRDLAVDGVTLRGAADSSRDVSSWTYRDGDVVIIGNSPPLVARLAATARGAEPALASLAEYRHFRARLPRGGADEAAFVVVTDGAIRRWCGPTWRIASARRVRAGAALAEAAAAHSAMALGVEDLRPIALGAAVPDFGALVTEADGPRSERYGTTRFLTPIAELELAYVTPEERDGYDAWRFGYDRLWSNAFDPIGARLALTERGLELDLVVMPIALRTDYREMLDIVGDVRLAPDAGDPNPAALAHAVLALDRDARLVKQLEEFLSMVAPDLERPLGWLGDHVAVWLDPDDALLAKARLAEDRDEFLDEHGDEVPLGVLLSVRDPLRLATFLGGVKALLQSAAPGVMSWETREATLVDGTKRPYVAIEPLEGAGWDDTPSLYYGIVPGRFVLSLREDVVHRALQRAADAVAGAGREAAAPREAWLGQSVGARFAGGFKDVLSLGIVDTELRRAMRRRAFAALPILNELRRVAPDRDPLEVLAATFGATVRCPGGGRFVWNDDHATYESSVFGCPADPRQGDVLPAAVREVRALELGLTFERVGEALNALHARARVTR